ncbi:helix-turn-helix transcriptional regulator [Aquimarina sp. 2201CG1-2-11]|uniref:LuxR C-terminal-related transcriptional regulator n=1 Tax=Aquimarina discodermiae TaxID=3231043 RepID=UPI003461AF01
MKISRFFLFCILFLCSKEIAAQYKFSGFANTENWSGDIYLSLIEDYRQLSGIYHEQIIKKTVSDSTGYFSFSGDNLPIQNRMYRIHIENCTKETHKPIHFNGVCPESKEILFIANNKDSITFPFSFDYEMFCTIVSTSEKSNSFIKVDSIIDEMRFAFASYRSEANRKLNAKKWLSTLQNYVSTQNEPLAELYVYSFLSNKTNDLHSYYLNDLKNHTYYDELLSRLQEKYPNSPYTIQYQKELAADKFLINPSTFSSTSPWLLVVLFVLLFSVFLNVLQYLSYKKKKNNLGGVEKKLTKQEQKVLDLILLDKTNKEIATTMFVSISTIKTHINNLYKKLNVHSREEVKSLYSNK